MAISKKSNVQAGSSEISGNTLQFLTDLKNNNDRQWFQDNKERYEEAKVEFELFISEIIQEIAGFDESVSHQTAKNCIFRIYRDVRFSKNKAPYKTHFGAHITSAQNKSDGDLRAGYYIHIEPGASMLAGGAYNPPSNWLKIIREEIDYDADGFKKILEDKNFVKYFGKLEGEKLKTLPRGYAKDHPEIELLKYKSFIAMHKCDDQTVLSSNFSEHVIKVFKALYPFDQFLNRGLQETY